MATKNNELKGLIYARFGTMGDFADALGWNRGKLSGFVTGNHEPSIKDIRAMAKLLDVKHSVLVNIFLPD